MAITLHGQPKARDLLVKIGTIARTDSSTLKMVLPKGAIIAEVLVHQQVAASTAAGAVSVGWSGATTALLSSFSLPTTSVGLVTAGTAAGSGILAAPLTEDKQVIASYTVGSSTAGGTGYFVVKYFIPGPGETLID